jgi:DNA-binding XRE family transcriptional regulator
MNDKKRNPGDFVFSNPHWTIADWGKFGPRALALQLEIERERFSRLVKETRKSMSLTRKQLAALAGVHSREIKLIEKLKGDPSFETEHRLCFTLNIEVRYKPESRGVKVDQTSN